jgi:hypothetical protein
LRAALVETIDLLTAKDEVIRLEEEQLAERHGITGADSHSPARLKIAEKITECRNKIAAIDDLERRVQPDLRASYLRQAVKWLLEV